jgi:hypothetical protein
MTKIPTNEGANEMKQQKTMESSKLDNLEEF